MDTSIPAPLCFFQTITGITPMRDPAAMAFDLFPILIVLGIIILGVVIL